MNTDVRDVTRRLRIVAQFLEWVFHLPPKCGAQVDFPVSAIRTTDGTTVRGNIMVTTLHTGHQITAQITPGYQDARGTFHEVPVDGVPVWASENGLVDLTPAADGLSCLIVNHDSVGVEAVTVTADADLGDGVVTITARLELLLEHPQATSLDLVASDEEPIPE